MPYPTRTTSYVGRPIFIKDHSQVVRTGGRQVDWTNVAVGYIDAATGKKRLPAGTVIGETLGAGKVSPRVAATNLATGILETDAVEDSLVDSLSGYSVIRSASVYENLLPDATGGPPAVLAGAIKTELQTNCPMGFHFEVYQDTR
jgi:hypothetical protein